MLVLDTDALSVLGRSSPEAGRLERWLADLGDPDVRTTIITFEEQMRGWLTAISRAKTVNDIAVRYQKLMDVIDRYAAIEVLPFDTEAVLKYQSLRSRYRRLGAMDLRIASIVLSREATLVTANLRDFSGVDGLKVASWK